MIDIVIALSLACSLLLSLFAFWIGRCARKLPIIDNHLSFDGLPYRWGMPARNQPTSDDAATARRVLLDGLASELAPLHPRNNAFPGEVFLALAGTEPDLLDEVAWWQADDFWQYAMYAAIAYIRAASRVGVPVRQACQALNPAS